MTEKLEFKYMSVSYNHIHPVVGDFKASSFFGGIQQQVPEMKAMLSA